MMAAAREGVLVVDDDVAIRNLLSTVLRRHGLRVETARDGEEGLWKVGAQHFGVVLLDLMMPRLNGHAFLARLRECEAPRPIILVISASHEADLRNVDRHMVTAIVRKPFDIFELAMLVTECLDTRAQTQLVPCEVSYPFITDARLSISSNNEIAPGIDHSEQNPAETALDEPEIENKAENLKIGK